MSESESYSLLISFLLFMLALAVYFFPALIANHRGRDSQFIFFLLNFFLGWTVIGWFVLLIMSMTGETRAARKQREEHLNLMRQMANTQQQQVAAPSVSRQPPESMPELPPSN